MCLVSPTVLYDCTAERDWGRIRAGTGRATDKKPVREGWAGQDRVKRRDIFSYTHVDHQTP